MGNSAIEWLQSRGVGGLRNARQVWAPRAGDTPAPTGSEAQSAEEACDRPSAGFNIEH